MVDARPLPVPSSKARTGWRPLRPASPGLTTFGAGLTFLDDPDTRDGRSKALGSAVRGGDGAARGASAPRHRHPAGTPESREEDDARPGFTTLTKRRAIPARTRRILRSVLRTAAVVLGLLLAGAARLAAGEPQPFAVDTSASHVRIHLGRSGLLKFLGHDHVIEAPIAEGRVEVVEDDPARSSVRLRFEADGLSVVPGTEPAADIPKVEARMRGPEVLDAERHPGIVFASSAVAGSATEPGRYRLGSRAACSSRGGRSRSRSRSRFARRAA